jgi:opacity protein-like surface antigen
MRSPGTGRRGKEIGMKRFGGATVLIAFVCLLAANGASAGIGVRVSGALSYVSYGDFNDAADYANREGLWASGATGKVNAIHWIPEFGGEVIVPVIPLLSVGVGVGIVSGKSSYVLQTGLGSYSYEHAMKAYPVTATAYVNLPMLPFAKPYLYLGGGAYRVKLTFEESTSSGSSTSEASAELQKWGFGLHGGAGLSFDIVPKVRFELGLKWRRAIVKGFEGTLRNPDGSSTDVFLAYHRDTDGNLNFAPESTADKDAFDEGSADLSGFAFTLGLAVSF